MQIIHQMTMDMALQLPALPVAAVQGDGNTRVLEITLLENGAPWQIPAAAVADVAFRKPDGTKGIYSKLPDGSTATSRSGNVLSATLAPQMLTCPGSVLATVVFRVDGGKTLAAFPFTVTVAPNPAAGAETSEDYFNPTQLGDLRAEIAAGLATKAPAGYGLGEHIYCHTGDSVPEFFDEQLATMPNGTKKFIEFAGDYAYTNGALFVGELCKRDNTNAYVSGYTYADAMGLYRAKYNGAWQPWEYVNPPMVLGVEYRTTERWNGKPVYAMLLNCGVAATGSVSVKYSDGTNIPVTHLVEEHYSVQAGANYMQGVFSNQYITAYFSKGPNPVIKITTAESSFADNGYILYATLKYTKD